MVKEEQGVTGETEKSTQFWVDDESEKSSLKR